MIAVAAFGAIVGDNAGYWLGLRYGYAPCDMVSALGCLKPVSSSGKYLKHGAKVVFLGRFVALLRILAAFLAGVNRMPWRAFLIANASGGIIWAVVFGIGGYFLVNCFFSFTTLSRPSCSHSRWLLSLDAVFFPEARHAPPDTAPAAR